MRPTVTGWGNSGKRLIGEARLPMPKPVDIGVIVTIAESFHLAGRPVRNKIVVLPAAWKRLFKINHEAAKS
jgi:hypothetical protein